MKTSLLYITCDNRWRRYHSVECASIQQVSDILAGQNRLVDLDIVYGQDYEEWLTVSATEKTTFPLLEGSFPISEEKTFHIGHLSECDICREHDGDVSDHFLGRLRFAFRPQEAGQEKVYRCEMIELAWASDVSEAKRLFAVSGKVKEEMNYFNSDFDFKGMTFFCGTASIMPVNWPGNGELASEPLDAGGGSLWYDPMSRKDREDLFNALVQINDNRFRNGLPFVPIDCDKGGKGNANH